MARGFGTTFGVGTTDKIATTVTADPTIRSYFIRLYPRTATGTQIYFRQENIGTTHLIQFLLAGGLLDFYITAGTLAPDGQWTVAFPSTGAWHSLGVFYDRSSAANIPIFYVDQTKPSVTVVAQPGNAAVSIAGNPFTLGNNAGQGFVCDGALADFATWNVQLTDSEFFAMGNGAHPLTIRTASLTAWLPLDGIQSPEPDLSGLVQNGTLTGTKLFTPGPPKMPFTPRWHRFLGWTPALPAAGLGWIINRRNKLMVPKKRA